MRNVALDLGAKKTTFCEVAGGRVCARTTVSVIAALESLLGPEAEPAQVAIEACREAWHVHETLTGWGNEVLLVDTTRVKQIGIGHHGRKTDRIDAEVLALAVERGGIPLAHLLSPGRRELRRLLGVRRTLVEARSNFVVTARGLAREQGHRLPSCHTESFVARVSSASIPRELEELLQPLLGTLSTMNEQLVAVEEAVTRFCAEEPIVNLLCTAPGVGPLVAAAFVSVVDEAKRFKRAHQLESYLGLVPGEESSGGKRRIGAITRKGSPYMRSLLTQSAWVIIRKKDSSDPLVKWGQAVSQRRGKKVAVIAVARKLAGILWSMWKHGSVYDAERLRLKSAHGLALQAQDIQLRADALKRARRKASGSITLKEVSH